EGGLVTLVVPPAPVSDQIDEEVLAELAPIGHRHLRGMQACKGVVGVHMHDRNLESLGEVASIEGRARVVRIGCVADLVVDDDMNRATGRIPLKTREVEGFGNNALSRKG